MPLPHHLIMLFKVVTRQARASTNQHKQPQDENENSFLSISRLFRAPPVLTGLDRWPIFLGSQEYQAFKDGFDMYLTPSIPSLAQALQANFGNMLLQIYNHEPTTDAIESMLHFEVDGDSTFCAQISPHLCFFKNAVVEYLWGTGHLVHPVLEDSSMCFKVVIVQNVPQDACFGGTLNPEIDLIPPIAHACIHRLDVFANAPIINWLVTAPSTHVDKSLLGICLHAPTGIKDAQEATS
ncbi:hypothetical protein BDR03DRAFT_987829 [Suillus americanus]|nr:hypothetical protein BDR03DRAFT_987829 [Suillus americanus]